MGRIYSALDKANRVAHDSLAFYREAMAKDSVVNAPPLPIPPYDAFDKANQVAHDSLAFYREVVGK